MRGVITRFFNFDALNVIPEVYTYAIIILVVLVFITWISIYSQQFGLAPKIFWLMTVTYIPIVGIAIYCVFCLLRADYPFLKRLGFGLQKAKQARDNL